MLYGLAQDREIVEEAIAGLEAAMSDFDIDRRDLTHDEYAQQRLNKLAFCGIDWRHDDTSVQRSWHRYGLELGNSVKDYTSVQAKPFDEHPVIAGTNSESKYTRIQEYYYYFLEDFDLQGMNLEEAIHEDFFTLLTAFYETYAEPEYKSLYLANVDLQRRLHKDSLSLSAEEVNEEDCFQIGEIVTDLHTELYTCDLLRQRPEGYREFIEENGFNEQYADLEQLTEDAYEAVERFTDLLEDIYMLLAEGNANDIIGTPSRIIDNLRVFYHEFTWKFVATILSIQTATGRDYTEIWRGSIKEIEWVTQTYNKRLNDIESTAEQANLIPSTEDYGFSDSDTDFLEESIQVTSIQS